MAFYGSILSNEVPWYGRRVRPARHVACPQRLKYIHDIKDGYIPYVEDSVYTNQSTDLDATRNLRTFGSYNSMIDWRQELMALAQQVQSSLVSNNSNESHRSRSTRSTQNRSRRTNSSVPNHSLEESSETNISKRLLTRRPTTHCRSSNPVKPKITIENNEQQTLATNNENQDPGIWLLPILCHVLRVDNIGDAQDWLINSNLTEKRLASELISRNMHDMQNRDNDGMSDVSIGDQSFTSSSNLNNLYWPYKFWQRQQQSKFTTDNCDTCERATSPVRILTPARRLLTAAPTERVFTNNERVFTAHERSFTATDRASSVNDRASTASVTIQPNSSTETDVPKHVPDIWRPAPKLLIPIPNNNNDRFSRRSHRVATSKSVSADSESKPTTASLSGKTPLI